MGWWYGKKKNGMYVGGHEQDDVEYFEAFIVQWKDYKNGWSHMIKMVTLLGFAIPPGQAFKLILVTHNKSTFYKNDRWQNCWSHKNDKATLQ